MTKLTVTELKLFLREPAVVFFAVAFPPLLLVILSAVPSFRQADPALGGLRVIDLYVPIVITVVLAMVALYNLPQVLATYREKGILRRMATTPVPPIKLLAAQVIMAMLVSLTMLVVILAFGGLAFDVAFPRQIVGYVLAYVLAALSVVTLGLFIAAVVRSGKAGGAIGNLAFFPVMFFAGLWVPRAAMPDWLARISDFTPLGAGVQAMDDAAGGAWPSLLHLGVMLAWTLAAGAAATRYFRWE